MQKDIKYLRSLFNYSTKKGEILNLRTDCVLVDEHEYPLLRTLVATDGHVITVIEIESQLQKGLYDRRDISILSTLAKHEAHDLIKNYQITDKDVKRFCDWKKIVACKFEYKEGDEKVMPIFNPDILSKFKMAARLSKREGVKMIPTHNHGPIVLKTKDTFKYGVMMPMNNYG